MLDLTITLQGEATVIARLENLAMAMPDMNKPFAIAGTLLTKFYSSVPFSSRGSVYGSAWPGLNPDYAKRKADMWGGGRPVLVASGKMASSFKFQSGKDLLRIYNSTGDLFAWHQLGMGHNPQRVMMLLDQDRKDVVIQAVRQYIEGLVNG